VPFNILEFYRASHTYVGVDTLRCRQARPGGAQGSRLPVLPAGIFKPFPIKPDAIYPLQDAKRAFVAVAGSSRHRVILRPA